MKKVTGKDVSLHLIRCMVLSQLKEKSLTNVPFHLLNQYLKVITELFLHMGKLVVAKLIQWSEERVLKIRELYRMLLSRFTATLTTHLTATKSFL